MATAEATAEVAIRLWPQAWPMLGRASIGGGVDGQSVLSLFPLG